MDEQLEVAAPEAGPGVAAYVDHRAEHDLDHREVLGGDLASQLARRAGTRHQLRDDRRHQLTNPPDPLAARVDREHQLLHAAVGLLDLEHPRDRGDETVHRVGIVEARPRDLHELLDALLEECLDQDGLVGEAPVDRPHPDAGVVCDVVERDVETALREQLARGVHHAPAVAFGICPQRALGRCHVEILSKWIDRFQLSGIVPPTGYR